MGSYASVRSAEIHGVDAVPVNVEVSIEKGPWSFNVFGGPDASAAESVVRVRTAIQSSGFEMPNASICVNLSPAEVRKTGTGYDLPIALGVLAASGQIDADELDGRLFSGELGMMGNVIPSRGDAVKAAYACASGLRPVLAPQTGYAPSGTAEVRSLSDFRGPIAAFPVQGGVDAGAKKNDYDFDEMVLAPQIAEALMAAAVGKHNIMLVGGGHSGMIARRLPSILPDLSDAEYEQAALIRSATRNSLDDIAGKARPFRAPHHSITISGMVGGGLPIMPGEASLAHGGVLFLGDVQEFETNVLQSLRQPLKDREVRIVRVRGIYDMPADFQLVAAAPPCPCGNLGNPHRACTCSSPVIERYQARLGGPISDLFGLVIDIPHQVFSEDVSTENRISSADMREQVCSALEFKAWRQKHGIGDLDGADFDSPAGYLPRSFMERSYCVARSFADLAGRELVMQEDLLKALSFRNRFPNSMSSLEAARFARGFRPAGGSAAIKPTIGQ